MRPARATVEHRLGCAAKLGTLCTGPDGQCPEARTTPSARAEVQRFTPILWWRASGAVPRGARRDCTERERRSGPTATEIKLP